MFFERPDTGERAVLVHLDMYDDAEREDPAEFQELVVSAGAVPVALVTGSRSTPNPKFYAGSGKVDEIRDTVRALEAEVVLFNHALSPAQERNLEHALQCRVLDRTGLILDIFAQRARTHEGKLQVELAQLEHMSTRLVRGWTHLERQKGGIGLRGPGETQLETDRRLLRERIKYIHKRLDKVRKQRDQGRRARLRAEIPTVSLVGYTNAGKSTLFNSLSMAGVYAADQLFATLDPTLRRLQMPDIGPIILADTVGFIRHLPHKLVDAFQATLQETSEASLLLHVVDAASAERDRNLEAVNLVLQEIDAADIPTLMVFNKIDLMERVEPHIDRNSKGRPIAVWLSAQRGEGLELLQQAVAECLGDDLFAETLTLKPAEGAMRAALYAQGCVLDEFWDESGNNLLQVRLPLSDFLQMLRRCDIEPERFGLRKQHKETCEDFEASLDFVVP
ncbi:GTPase HflX [Pokkaliibacter sp. MBI-7]|uniref:ribosome rescue GTPase HflX n=1 Tax=Pokkaliibacter sp. MBI-7 TaxID=3040600 RepID=UPI00244913CC|nr:ribosome rescue GTPase HflX [Pokkaliibacter sp. MBI-7]MDH2432221.1 GTPase HflX [Pokkaliibacter sp. MBI-7]